MSLLWASAQVKSSQDQKSEAGNMGVHGTSLHNTTASLHTHTVSPQRACLTSKDNALEMWTAGLVAGQRRWQKKIEAAMMVRWKRG